MKNKLIYADYDPATGVSAVLIRNRYGTFQGYAKCHPEEEAPSTFAGCRYAEARAHIESMTYQIALLKAQIDELKTFENILKSMKGYDASSMENKRLRKRIHELNAERNEKKKLAAAMKKALKKSMAEHDEYIEKHKKTSK
jgi:regulator of replication initiation timing